MRHAAGAFVLSAALIACLAVGTDATGADGPAVEARIPAPTGPFAVGTTTFDVDTGRPETMTDDAEDRRRIVVQLWYPAARGDCTPAPYMDAATSRAVAEDLPPDFGLRVHHDGCLDAPPAAAPATGARWPVVLFSHGFGATRSTATALLEELASRGTVAVAIHHTFGSQFTAFTDGTAIPWDESRLGPERFEEQLQIWIDDARSTLAFLDALDSRPGSRLAGRLALDRVGYAGHSFGGLTAFAIAARRAEPRIAAVVDLDGRLLPSLPKPLALDVPLLLLLSEPSPTRLEDFAPGPDVYLARVPTSTHTSFTDLPVLFDAFAPKLLLRDDGTSALAPAKAILITREAVAGFFDCTLRSRVESCEGLRSLLAPMSGS